MAVFLSKIYSDVKVQHEKKLQYLRMDLHYATPGEVKISMITYVENIIKDSSHTRHRTFLWGAWRHKFIQITWTSSSWLLPQCGQTPIYMLSCRIITDWVFCLAHILTLDEVIFIQALHDIFINYAHGFHHPSIGNNRYSIEYVCYMYYIRFALFW